MMHLLGGNDTAWNFNLFNSTTWRPKSQIPKVLFKTQPICSPLSLSLSLFLSLSDLKTFRLLLLELKSNKKRKKKKRKRKKQREMFFFFHV